MASNLRKTFLFFTLILLKTSCPLLAEFNLYSEAENAYSVYNPLINQTLRTFAQEMNKELGLIATGDGGCMHEKIEEVHMSFETYRRATIEEARALLLIVINKFVQAINENQKLHPFLIEHPFSYKQVSITITFDNLYKAYCDGSVSTVMNIPNDAAVIENRNRIFYYATDPYTSDNIPLYSEFYEEAAKELAAHPITDPKFHHTTELETVFDEALSSFVKQVEKECRLRCWNIGGKLTQKVEGIGAQFTAFYRGTQEQARELEVYVAQKLLDHINTNEKLRPYLKQHPFTVDDLKMQIRFRNKKYTGYYDGTMESVSIEGNQITYMQDRPNGKGSRIDAFLQPHCPLFGKETYHEALETLKKNPKSKRKYALKFPEN